MLGMGDNSVLVGRDGRMFYLGEEAVRQSAGLVLRDQTGGRHGRRSSRR